MIRPGNERFRKFDLRKTLISASKGTRVYHPRYNLQRHILYPSPVLGITRKNLVRKPCAQGWP